MADYERPNAQVVDGVVHVRASAAGSCQVALLWDMQASEGLIDSRPSPPPPQMVEAMEDSKSLEEQAIDLLRDYMTRQDEAVVITSNQQTASYVADDFVISGTPDAYSSDGIIYEIKCMGPDTYRQFVDGGVWEKYLMQCGAYELIEGMPVELVVFEKVKGALTGQFEIIPVDSEWSNKVFKRVMDLAKVDLREYQTCTGDSEWCPWTEWHTRPQLESECVQAYNEWQELKEAIATLTVEMNEKKAVVEQAVKELGGKAGIETSDGEIKLTWVETHVKEKQPREYDRKYLNVSKPKK